MCSNFQQRQNLIYRKTENWKPPLFTRNVNLWQKYLSFSRRFFDLQAGSLWNDLTIKLPKIRGTVLDVGCGIQPYKSLFSSSVKYIGIDTIDSKAKFGYEMPDTIYFSGDTWPVETESIDFVLCTETIEHVPEPAIFLSEMYRCLHKGGCILLTVPFAARWHFIPYDYWRFTPAGLNHLFEKTGFIDIAVYARGNEVTVACYKHMTLLLSLLLSQSSNPVLAWTCRLIGLILTPILLSLAIIGNISLKLWGGDDCLGYTVFATRPQIDNQDT